MYYVFTNGNYFAAIILRRFLEKYSKSVTVIVIQGGYSGKGKWSTLRNSVGKVSISFILYKIFVSFILSYYRFIRSGNYTVLDLCRKHGIRNYKVVNVNSTIVQQLISTHNPEYLISVSCPQLINDSILLHFKSAINIHSSLLPKYCGLAPYFWAMNNSEKIAGTSVHYMTSKFDEGNILCQEHIEINDRWSMFYLFYQLALLGEHCLLNASKLMISGNKGIVQNITSKSYYSNPTGDDVRHFKKKGKKLIRMEDLLHIESI